MPKKKALQKDDSLISGSALIILGIIFILNIALGWGAMWPLFIGFAGVMTIISYLVNREDKEGAIIGSTILFTLTVFFLLFTTGLLDWSAMAWLWPGFILAPGLGLLVSYLLGDKEKLLPAGVLITLFIVFISASSFSLWAYYWPIILIIIGAIILILTRSKKAK